MMKARHVECERGQTLGCTTCQRHSSKFAKTGKNMITEILPSLKTSNSAQPEIEEGVIKEETEKGKQR